MITPDLLRYACQMALPGFNEAAQRLLQAARVLVVGAGGLGCPAAQYLVSAGVGEVGIADHDKVSISNLHRQVLFNAGDVGLHKSVVACARLQQQNPGIKLVTHDLKITRANILDIIRDYDMVVDATDNFDARYLINDACVMMGKPVVYGAIYQFEGQVAVWNVANDDGTFKPNYRDLFPEVDAAQVPSCADGGVIPTLAGIIGCIQANEVIKYITGIGEVLGGKILIFDALTMQSRIIKIGKVTNTFINSLPQTVEIPVMTVAQVKKALLEKTIELLDVRTDQERDVIDIGGVHIEHDELYDHIDYLNGGIAKVLYCSSGKRSGEAVKQLKAQYPEMQIFSLEGGLKAWFEDNAMQE